MLNLQEIENTIEELENGDTTFSACEKLAALYIVRDRMKMEDGQAEKEINDILPSYRRYADTKRKFHSHELTEDAVIIGMQLVCSEITDLVRILYANSEMENERKSLYNMVSDLAKILV